MGETSTAKQRYPDMPSSVIKQINYNRDHARLTITFSSGRVYEYYAVPAETYGAFRTAPSKGTFFNTRIRDHFPFKEITPGNAPRKRA